MRILLVNKFYYPRGGDCMAMMRTEALLREQGHEVAVFAMNHAQNLPHPSSSHFATEVQMNGNLAQRWRAVRRIMGHGDIRASFTQALHDFKPDVVHLHNVHSYLSPIVARLAHERGCRVVWTLHDYKLLCPRYTCMRDGALCKLCFHGKADVILHACMKNSVVASVLAWAEAKKWNRDQLCRWVDAFICPSQFMAQMMTEGGFLGDKLIVLNNFAEPAPLVAPSKRGDYYCYVGRISAEKGIKTLLQAAAQLPLRLKIAGGGPLLDELKEEFAHAGHIEFLGPLPQLDTQILLAQARCSVLPTECAENNPMSVIESLVAGTPVVTTTMGGVPELIIPDNGLLCPPAQPDALAAALREACSRTWNHAAIAADARNRFAPAKHLSALMGIYRP
ncbi:MAG: glycosyltransferase [Muribaculaceae bacterium]|nr:glycosyltransferase [Muribaculaceae bacterium]